MSAIDIITNYWMIVLPLILLLVIVIYFLARRGYLTGLNLFGLGIDLDRDKLARGKSTRYFDRSDSTEFVTYGEELLQKARRVVLIGTGINLLQRDPVFLAVAERAARGECDLEIYMANPYSPDIEMRLVEEELGSMKPPVGQTGLVQRLNSMLEKLKQLNWPDNFSIKLFWNYPTFAMFILDDDYFFYPYGYTLLGNFSPVEHLVKDNKAHKPMIDFLEDQYRRIKADSVDARLVLGIHHGEEISLDQLQPFAVYFIPKAHTPLYKYGSKVLGFDIRSRYSEASPLAAHVGTAADFGFHLTIADALYFFSESEIERLHKEIELLARGFKPFRLTDLQVQAWAPASRTIVLSCQQETGSLEALHHELVFRVNRRAAASHYSLGLSQVDRDSNLRRARRMIKRYRAPYILDSFQPHFSLLTATAPDAMDSVAADLQTLYDETVSDTTIEVETLALMTQPSMNKPWEIAWEIPLG